MVSQNAPRPGTPLEEQVQKLGKEIFERMKGETPGIFDTSWWSGKLMDWAMQDEQFKVNMFRFVDVLPSLRTAEQISEHVQEYLLQQDLEMPAVMKAALGMAGGSGFTGKLAANTMKKNIEQMAERFIVGKDGKDALKELRKIHKDGMAFTVDLLGEAAVSDKESVDYLHRYEELVDTLSKEVPTFAADPLVDEGVDGEKIPRVNVSLKLSALDATLNSLDPEGSADRLAARLLPMLKKARANNVFVNVDMEQFSLRETTYRVFERLCMDSALKDYPHLGVVVQAYLRDSDADLDRLVRLARNRGTPLTVRLVKGAYWDYETVLAAQRGWPCPVFSVKEHTDAMYEKLSARMMDEWRHVRPAFGSHNTRSVAAALALAKQKSVPDKAVEVQMLYGMAEPPRRAIRGMGTRVRVYAPIGELLPGMAYLVRRLLENTSNQSFLRASHHDNVDVATLLKAPEPFDGKAGGAAVNAEFHNLAFLDLAMADNQARMKKAIDDVRRDWVGKEHPIVINGEKLTTGQWEPSYNPHNPEEIIGKVASAQPEHTKKALEVARKAYEKWVDAPVDVRAGVLEKAANLMEQDRARLAALMVLEEGKPWKEADADLAEAVDFCRYYAQEMRRLGKPRRMGKIPGELNHLFYEGRGVVVVIAPWNFPLAILCGMTTAALVTGNAVIMKPAGQSSVIGAHLFRILQEAGAPPDVLQFVPGRGSVVGPALVASPEVDMIAFTGSMEVGLGLAETAGHTLPGQRNVKKVIIEMGGKNAVIVDADADLDEAVLGVMYSAFGYAGQKCSACSRVIVVEEAYDLFCQRLGAAVKDLVMGDPCHPATQLPPVIDRPSQERLLRAIAGFKKEHTLLAEKDVPGSLKGCYVPPTVFCDVDPRSTLAQEELFGPVVAVTKAKDFDEALAMANGVRYALTGGVFSRSPAHLAAARQRFRVGNLYLNRGTTGALVFRQPFGGSRMSGVGSKSGGPDYLLQFMDPRVVTENTMRRGFTPPDELEG
ncbi:MAG: bifunctional proline dehydrogenase/L-glutamate gamma-semialdehyde dehydrogenase [Deltaproteobacteria bacterium]|nr:bifunctional proline dehydrogenase/L-glutamate gamma-semialdehyde dehydrogenase [Deltaproteobacteria bacterium]